MDTDYDHPPSFRPPGSSPNPDQQDTMSRKPVPFTTGQSRPGSNQQAQANNYSSRFPSNQYSQETYSQVTQQPAQSQSQSQTQTPQARSRSSTQTASPQRQGGGAGGGVGLAPSSYHTSRPANGNSTPKSPAVQSPSQQYQSLYSRPASSYQSSSNRPNVPNSTQPLQSQPQQSNVPQQSQAPPSSSSSSHSTSQFTASISGPPLTRKTHLLLLNPTSTAHTTNTILHSLRPKLPPHVEITGYTAPFPSPMAIESQTDAILASETVVRDLAPHSAHNSETVLNFDGILVVSYFPLSNLVDSLREIYDVPIVGVLEASLYLARSLGGRFGIVASGGRRSRVCHADAVSAIGLERFDVGAEIVHLGGSTGSTGGSLGGSGSFGGGGAASGGGGIGPSGSSGNTGGGSTTGDPDPHHHQISHTRGGGGGSSKDPASESGLLQKKIGAASHRLVMKGADIVIMALSPFVSGNTEAAIRAAKDAVRDDDGRRLVNVVDPVEAGVVMLTALAGMGCPTSKKGVYASAAEARRARGQDWL